MKQIKISEIMETSLEGIGKPYQTSMVVSYILEQNKAINEENTMSSNEIIDKYHIILHKHPNVVFIPDNTIKTYLSLIASSDSYPIFCAGRKKGYFLDLKYGEQPAMTQEFPSEEKNLLECVLYPWLTSWLTTEGFEMVRNISNKKKMGKWGNPDIVGLKIIELFKSTILEIVTIEAKRSFDNWRHDIFEAVAHTTFANKSYFAFMCKKSDKIDKKMIQYAQKFKIGIIAIILEDEPTESDGLKFEDIEIRKVLPAPDQNPILEIQKDFLMNLGIRDFEDFINFSNSD